MASLSSRAFGEILVDCGNKIVTRVNYSNKLQQNCDIMFCYCHSI